MKVVSIEGEGSCIHNMMDSFDYIEQLRSAIILRESFSPKQTHVWAFHQMA